jgi:hypothetical protein
MKSKDIDNPNSPENLLVPWINSNTTRFYAYGNGDTVTFGKTLLACIFDFADSHNKLLEMYNWLDSQEARDVLLSEACDTSGGWILDAVEQMVQLVNKLENDTDDDTDEIIKKIIDENAYYLEPLRYDLVLK